MRHHSTLGGTAVLAAALLVAGTSASATPAHHEPTLIGRAVLPVATYAPGPPAGAAVASANGFTLPTPSQPVEGFSAVIDGRHEGEYLAMPDNGFGTFANSADFLIRAYYVTPTFKTAHGGDGSVRVDTRRFISFRDPDHLFPYAMTLGTDPKRLFTGADIDPESLQWGRHGDLWMGEEFGPWLLHFSSTGVLLDPPFAAPGGLRSPGHPDIRNTTTVATQQGSRGFEAIAISPDGRYVYAALEGATEADKAAGLTTRRHIFQFDTRRKVFTDRQWEFATEDPSYMVSDMAALDRTHLLLIERDGGKGLLALFRKVYVVDLGTDVAGYVAAREVVDLAAIADPNLVSLPAIHAGDVGLGNPFRVTCESIEAIHPLGGDRVLFGCDNNLPNAGRNPGLADDNELIVVRVPGLHDDEH